MSPRLIIGLALAGIIALGAGINWILVSQRAEGQSGGGTSVAKPASDAERREKFFGGDPERNVRGGQEMKPRW